MLAIRAFSVCAVLLYCLTDVWCPAVVQAQAGSGVPSLRLSELEVATPAPRPLDHEFRVQMRGARWMMTIGSGMIAGAIVGLGMWQLRDSGCERDGSEPLYMPGIGAAVIGFAGAGLLTGGVMRIGGVPISYRRTRPASQGRLAGMVGGAILSAAVSNFAVLLSGASQWTKCATN